MGPNGVAMTSSIADWEALPDHLRQNILSLGGQALADQIEPIITATPSGLEAVKTTFQEPLSKGSGRLSLLPDKEGKSRLFAIVDY